MNLTKTLSVAFPLTLIAASLSGCSASKGIKPSQATSTQFLQKMQAHQFASAYGLLSTPCQAATTQQQMRDYRELVEKNRGKVQSWTQQGVNIYAGSGGSSVTLSYGLRCAKGDSSVRFVCVEENDKWRIQAFNLSG